MPTNRTRRSRIARADPMAEMRAWSEIFDTEFDFFGDGKAFGLALDEHGRADRAATASAWARLGRLFLDNSAPQPDRKPWALKQFGEPPCL